MSEPAKPEKVKLSVLLVKVSQIAAGADAKGILPNQEGHDANTAPSLAMRWCASILRIFLARTIEHIVETRRSLAEIRREVFGGPEIPATENKPALPAVVSLAGLRAQVDEMSKLLEQIVGAIRQAQQMAGQGAGGADAGGAAGGGAGDAGGSAGSDAGANGSNGEPPSAEDAAAAAQMAELDKLAADLAKAAKEGVPIQTGPKPPVPPTGSTVVPIRPPVAPPVAPPTPPPSEADKV
jgi:hypothetical protein